MPLLLCLLLLLPSVTFAQSGFSNDLGETTLYNFGSVSGFSQSIGNTEIYSFSNGTSAFRNQIGNIGIYSGSVPNLNGTTNRIGETTFGTWQDGTFSTHQSIGDFTFHNFSNSRTCTSTRIGSTTFTNCP